MSLILGALGALVAASVSVGEVLIKVGLAVQGLKAIGNALVSIAKALGIIKPERDVEELGDRALQAEEQGITPDKYDSYAAWAKVIDGDDWGYDPEKNKDMPSEKKILKGVEVSTAVTMEKFPDLPIQEFYTLAGNNPEFFTVERMDEIGKLADSDSDAFGNIVKYLTGDAKDHASIDSAIDNLMGIEKIINPSISDNLAYDRVAGYRAMK